MLRARDPVGTTTWRSVTDRTVALPRPMPLMNSIAATMIANAAPCAVGAASNTEQAQVDKASEPTKARPKPKREAPASAMSVPTSAPAPAADSARPYCPVVRPRSLIA